MRLSLSAISTINASFEEDVRAYAGAGFDAIGLWEFKLPPDDDANRALLAEHGLAVSNCIPITPSFLQLAIPGLEGPADPAVRLAALESSVRRLALYDPECVVCLAGPVGDRTEAEARSVLVDGLRHLASVARAVDVPVGFEPVHPSQREMASFITSIEDAVAVLGDAGLDDVGLLLDLYHVGDDPAVWDMIGRAAYRISGVHVADWPTEPTRTDRELPGHGLGRTRELIEALELSGFAGSLDVEIFGSPDGFWGLGVEEAARQAYVAISRLV